MALRAIFVSIHNSYTWLVVALQQPMVWQPSQYQDKVMLLVYDELANDLHMHPYIWSKFYDWCCLKTDSVLMPNTNTSYCLLPSMFTRYYFQQHWYSFGSSMGFTYLLFHTCPLSIDHIMMLTWHLLCIQMLVSSNTYSAFSIIQPSHLHFDYYYQHNLMLIWPKIFLVGTWDDTITFFF